MISKPAPQNIAAAWGRGSTQLLTRHARAGDHFSRGPKGDLFQFVMAKCSELRSNMGTPALVSLSRFSISVAEKSVLLQNARAN
jgi:hypothetical protein